MSTVITIPVKEVTALGPNGEPENAFAPATPFPPNAIKIECDGKNFYVTVG